MRKLLILLLVSVLLLATAGCAPETEGSADPLQGEGSVKNAVVKEVNINNRAENPALVAVEELMRTVAKKNQVTWDSSWLQPTKDGRNYEANIPFTSSVDGKTWIQRVLVDAQTGEATFQVKNSEGSVITWKFLWEDPNYYFDCSATYSGISSSYSQLMQKIADVNEEQAKTLAAAGEENADTPKMDAKKITIIIICIVLAALIVLIVILLRKKSPAETVTPPKVSERSNVISQKPTTNISEQREKLQETTNVGNKETTPASASLDYSKAISTDIYASDKEG